ncbi:hypothetical protein [uncultured Succinivibrio sp.]|uniref:hypothetical protein n=1 Tax=uncultured Succinivibrio sp. TaxID=540749 RepID=UPI0025FF8E0E|nr:hypothetical protein [uncultured Succinivibrio sp.]
MQNPLELIKLLSKVESGDASESELHDFICLLLKKKVDIRLTEGTFSKKNQIRDLTAKPDAEDCDLTAKPDAEDCAKLKLAMKVSSSQFPMNSRMPALGINPVHKK